MPNRPIILAPWQVRALQEGRLKQIRVPDEVEMVLESGVILRQIPEAPNEDYMAGSDGQVYSRTRFSGFGRKEYTDWYPLKAYKSKKGYLTVTICHKNKKMTRHIHRLICSAFHGEPNPRTLMTRHLDGNQINNLPDNLAWGTQIDNWRDRRVHGTASVGEKHWAAKFTNAEREHIRWAIQKGLCSQRHAARMLGVGQQSICSIVHSEI